MLIRIISWLSFLYLEILGLSQISDRRILELTRGLCVLRKTLVVAQIRNPKSQIRLRRDQSYLRHQRIGFLADVVGQIAQFEQRI